MASESADIRIGPSSSGPGRVLLLVSCALSTLLPSLATAILWHMADPPNPVFRLFEREDSIVFAHFMEAILASAFIAPFAVGLLFRKVLRSPVPVTWLTISGILQVLFVGYGFMWAEFAKGGGAC